MGMGVNAKCSCGYEREFFYDVGMLGFQYPEQIFQQIKKGKHVKYGINPEDVTSETDIKFDDIKYKVYFCKKCNTFENFLYYSIMDRNLNKKTPVVKCKKCSETMKSISMEKLNNIKCPKCSKILSFDNYYLSSFCWD